MQAFGPDAAAVAEAEELIAASRGGAQRFKGRMIESMHVEEAKLTIERSRHAMGDADRFAPERERIMRLVFGFLLASVAFAAAAPLSAKGVSEADLRGHIEVLASDEFEGRKPGTEGEAKTDQIYCRCNGPRQALSPPRRTAAGSSR